MSLVLVIKDELDPLLYDMMANSSRLPVMVFPSITFGIGVTQLRWSSFDKSKGNLNVGNA